MAKLPAPVEKEEKKGIRLKRKVKTVEKESNDFISSFIAAARKITKDKESAWCLSDQEDEHVTAWWKTPFADLNRIFKNRGIPVGRALELFGKKSSGKTALAKFLAALVSRTSYVLYLDFEVSLDKEQVQGVPGANPDNFALVTPETMEEGWALIYQFLDSLKKNKKVTKENPAMIVFDSVAMAPTKAEMESDTQQVASQARVMSVNSRKFRRRLTRSNCICIFINQVRHGIGGFGFGENITRPGGEALEFMCDIMLKMFIYKSDQVGSGENKDVRGLTIGVQAEKNRFGKLRAQTEYYLSLDQNPALGGPDPVRTALNILTRRGSVKKKKVKVKENGKIKTNKFLTVNFNEEKVDVLEKEWPTFFAKNKKKLNDLIASKANVVYTDDESDDEEEEGDEE